VLSIIDLALSSTSIPPPPLILLSVFSPFAFISFFLLLLLPLPLPLLWKLLLWDTVLQLVQHFILKMERVLYWDHWQMITMLLAAFKWDTVLIPDQSQIAGKYFYMFSSTSGTHTHKKLSRTRRERPVKEVCRECLRPHNHSPVFLWISNLMLGSGWSRSRYKKQKQLFKRAQEVDDSKCIWKETEESKKLFWLFENGRRNTHFRILALV